MLKTNNFQSVVNGAVETGIVASPISSKLHTESNTILSSLGTDGQLFLGTMKLWNQFKMLSAPLFSMSELEGNTIYTNGFGTTLGFTLPFDLGLPMIIENLCTDKVKPGQGGQAFPIALSENVYVAGDVITNDYRNGKQLIIQPDEVTPHGSAWRYMVKLVTMDEEEDYFPPYFLEPGTHFMKIDNRSGEQDTNVSGLTNVERSGLKHYSYITSNSEMAISHWITSHADILSVEDIVKNPQLGWLNQYGDLSGKDAVLNFVNRNDKGAVTGLSWMPKIIAGMTIELATMKERSLMWSRGMAIQGNKGQIRVAPGYYQQIKNRGNYQTYSDFKQLPNLLKNIVGQLFANRADIPFSARRVKFRMGMGAMIEMQKAFMTQFKSDNPFTIMADHPALSGMLTGQHDKLAYKPIRITSVQYPEVGLVDIEHDPTLDMIDLDVPQIPYAGALPNSSYIVFVEDVTKQDFSNAMPTGGYNVADGFNNGSNIMSIKPKNYTDTMAFKVGTGCNPTLKKFIGISPNSFVHSEDKKGFGVTMMTCGELWVKDPSRTVLVEYTPESGFYY